ncbi:MAG: hypothetical protein AAFQ82_04920, partial [Myxococcota bacterium]
MNSKGPQIGMPWHGGTKPREPGTSSKRRGRVWHFGDSARDEDRGRSTTQLDLLSRAPVPRRPQSVARPSTSPSASTSFVSSRDDGPGASELWEGTPAQAVPAHVRLGTVGYRYPQWAGTVFGADATLESIHQNGLSDYASHSLFRAVGLPCHELVPDERELLWQLLELPEGYTPVVMLNPGLSTPLFPRRKLLDAANGDASDAGHFNPSFLDPRLFRDEVFPALQELQAVCDTELIVTLTVPPLLRESGVPPYPFLWRLERLATVVPTGIRLAVELRELDYVTEDYRAFLREAGWIHV